jgi:hypothetical protein
MLQPIEVYLERLKNAGYSDEDLEYVKEFRENSEHMTFEQFDHLFRAGIISRFKKLKKKRNLFFRDEKLYYLNHYHRKYHVVGEFKN